MIKVVNSITIAPNRGKEAVDFLKRWAAMDNKALPGHSTAMATDTLDRILYVNTFESRSQREQYVKDQGDNPEAQAILKEFRDSDYFVPGSLEQQIYDVLS